MPTLDDIPILPVATPTGDDLIPISDPSSTSSSKVSAIRLNQISGLNAGEIATDTDGGSITISTRVTVISGSNTSSLTLPAASGALRELFIINDASATATITSPAAIAAGTEAIATTTSAHLLSNGTGWYRV